MGLLGSSLVLYLLLGGAVAVAVYLSDRERRPGERLFLVLTAVPFWPLYLPGLLSRGGPAAGESSGEPPAGDGLAAVTTQAEAELDAASSDLDGWAGSDRARDRLRELRPAWQARVERIRAMDRLLSLPYGAGPPDLAEPSSAQDERLRHSREAWRQNLERLRRLRQQAYADLLASLARVREVVMLLHLARFGGAPASRAEELVAQVAAAVAGPETAAGGAGAEPPPETERDREAEAMTTRPPFLGHRRR
jgi:hypothetical protein